MIMMSSKKAGVWRLLSETSHIIITHPRNFVTLSALFLFPITFFTALYPDLLLHPTPHYNQILSTPVSEKTGTPPLAKSQFLLYIIVALFFNICATSSITRATINALLDRPLPSLKSFPLLFFPILGTKLATLFIMGLTVLAFSLFMGLTAVVFGLFFGMDFITSRYFMASFYVETGVLVGVMTYLGVQWSLIYPIVVLESTWGFAPLKRSWYLVKGMRLRGVIFVMIILFQIPSLIMWMWDKNLMANYNEGRHAGWVIALMVIYAVFVTIVSLYGLVFFAVLCVYCKELHGETVLSQFDDKSGVEFAKLPLDDLL